MAAAGLAVNTVYGAQPYWPEKKLRICITGAAASREALRAHAAATRRAAAAAAGRRADARQKGRNAEKVHAPVASRQAPAASSRRTWRSG
jgi:hypothetical protein